MAFPHSSFFAQWLHAGDKAEEVEESYRTFPCRKDRAQGPINFLPRTLSCVLGVSFLKHMQRGKPPLCLTLTCRLSLAVGIFGL